MTKSFRTFGYTINYGYSAKQKKEAVKAVLDGTGISSHQGALNNGELKSIYCGLNRVCRPCWHYGSH